MDNCEEIKLNNGIRRQMVKAKAQTQAEYEDKATKKARWGPINGWTTTKRREDRTLRLWKMLFNLWIRPGLVVFTLICVFIDFVFNFNLSHVSPPSHPPSLFYAPRGFFTLRLLLPLKTPSVTHHISANINQSLPLILSLCSHQSFLGHSIPSVSPRLPLTLFPKPLHEQ